MFKKLCTVYEGDNEQQKYMLLQEFYSYSYKKGILRYISNLENLIHKLGQLKQEIHETMLIKKILSSLPENFKHFISAWDSTPKSEKKNGQLLINRLTAEETRQKNEPDNNDQAAFKTSFM